MKVYIAGPMSGYPDDNFPAFHAAAAKLRERGYDVVSPAEQGLDGIKGITWLECMRHDVQLVAGVDAVAVLPGWENSKGANVEVALARGLGLVVFDVETFDAPTALPCVDGLEGALAEAADWGAATFKYQTPESKAEHLRREANELAADPYDATEMADVAILLAGLARLTGTDLRAAVRAKMAINRARKWSEPDEQGVCSHVEETLTTAEQK